MMEKINPKAISVLVPTYNEEGNIESLIYRIDRSLRISNYDYEIICIDDNSTDSTFEKIKNLSLKLPVKAQRKQGLKGKAYSILEGVKASRYDIIAMIDADLQYPPEAIVKMAAMIGESDIIVAKRDSRQEPRLRQFTSKVFEFIFSRMLHNLHCDAQSGLKIFRREIFERVTIDPTPWTFDMEFLIKARNAGYKIANYSILFSKRNAGESKVNVLSGAFEIGLNAFKLKFMEHFPIPFSKNVRLNEGTGFHFKGDKFMTYAPRHFTESAFHNFTTLQKVLIADAVVILALLLLIDWHMTVVSIIAAVTLIYLLDMIFNTYVLFLGISFNRKRNEEYDTNLYGVELPLYTILCPLYKEWEVVPQFITAMQSLEYPKDKLQVLLLLEQNDTQTIDKIKSYNLPEYFEILVVPDSKPKTKPKACNYGLRHARGKYAVIYDAEDVPEPTQLLKAVSGFSNAPKNVICLQAKLNYFNPRHNLLTRLFTAEYSLWFDLMLPGLQSLNAPIPLGGTSNHFITEALKQLGGWDVFNVTEDCDLGIRLYKHGFQTRIMNSTTYEEANSQIFNWINQRSRWIKGYMQTYLVYMRDPLLTLKQMGAWGFFVFQLTVGGKILTVFINPVLWFITIVYFIFRPVYGPLIESFFPPSTFYFGVISFTIGNFLYLYSYMMAAASRKYYDLVKYGYMIPLYWALMSVASWQALQSLIFTPHYWAKTIHGFHLRTVQSTEDTASEESFESKQELIIGYKNKAYVSTK